MKILLVNKYLYRRGGDAVVTLSTGELLKARGHDVLYWGMKHPNNPSYLGDDCFVNYIDYQAPASVSRKLSLAFNCLYSMEAKSKLEIFFKKTGLPDVVHLNNFSHQLSPSILHVFKKHRVPVVMTVHDYKLICASYLMMNKLEVCEACINKRFFNCLINKCVKKSVLMSFVGMIEMYLHHKILRLYDCVDLFIAPSQFLKQKIVEMGFDKNIVHIPNFVNLPHVENSLNSSENSIVYFGRLSSEKGLSTLIRAMKALPDIKLKIIGEGPLSTTIIDEIKNLGLRNVQLLGYKYPRELEDEILKSLFVVLPSECYEVFSMTIVESFALGRPVIASNIGGIPELVVNGVTGFTFEVRNVQDLVSKIIKLIHSPDLRKQMGNNARLFVERKLNSDNYYNRLMTVYGQVIKDNCR